MHRRIIFFIVLIALFILPRHLLFAEINLSGGISERIRHEFRKNVYDLENDTKDNRNFFRFKTSVWGQTSFDKDLGLYLKLTNENIAYTYWAGSSSSAGKSASKKGYRYNIDEVVFDNFYGDIKNFAGFPVDLRLGRQDLNDYGEGFLINDGTPGDSSRTYYFNAAKTSWRLNPKNTVDFLFIKDNKTDDIFPVLNEQSPQRQLNASNETAYAFYHKNNISEDFRMEDYYIYKTEDTAESASARMTQKDTQLNTLGSFAEYKFAPWVLKGQFAYQTGSYGEDRRQGLGGYGYLDRDFKGLPGSPKLSLGAIYLSGNDQGTDTDEAWDPLFSHWPWFSEFVGTSYSSESETYYWTNLQAYRLLLTLLTTKKTKLTLGYNFLRANEQVAATSTLFSGSGKNRGQLLQAKLDYKITKNITGFISAEYFFPGNFYVKTADNGMYLKSEITIKF